MTFYNKVKIMKKIFLSYGHDEHEEYIQKIKLAIEKESLNVWMDSKEIRIKDDWQNTIEKAILQSDSILFCITPLFFTTTRWFLFE